MQIIARQAWSQRIGTIVKYFKREIVTAWVSVHLWQEPDWNQGLSVSVSCIVLLFSYSLENIENWPLTCGCKLTQRNLKTRLSWTIVLYWLWLKRLQMMHFLPEQDKFSGNVAICGEQFRITWCGSSYIKLDNNEILYGLHGVSGVWLVPCD